MRPRDARLDGFVVTEPRAPRYATLSASTGIHWSVLDRLAIDPGALPASAIAIVKNHVGDATFQVTRKLGVLAGANMLLAAIGRRATADGGGAADKPQDDEGEECIGCGHDRSDHENDEECSRCSCERYQSENDAKQAAPPPPPPKRKAPPGKKTPPEKAPPPTQRQRAELLARMSAPRTAAPVDVQAVAARQGIDPERIAASARALGFSTKGRP